MSVQFGRWNWENQIPSPRYLEKIAATLAPFGPDSNEIFSKNGLTVIHRAFHTTAESRRQTQPYISQSGSVVTWDGRLDNRSNLVDKLKGSVSSQSSDVEIVATAFDIWGTACFGELIGDWALSVCKSDTRMVILAKDPIGLRHLYYYYPTASNEVIWSSLLDPLVLFSRRQFAPCEEYLAGWLSGHHPSPRLTPYSGIYSVPPSCCVLFEPNRHAVKQYWDFNSGYRVRYSTDTEYEEHFRAVFATAVQRRLRSDTPVLAHLSGGMDSSSIVCMADTLVHTTSIHLPSVDTISWYDDSNPGLDERPYFTKVEEKRGKAGVHIDLQPFGYGQCSRELHLSAFESQRFLPTPYSSNSHPDFFRLYGACIKSKGYRVVLSGVGGDDVMGSGVPSPQPELQNLIASARFFRLARQLDAWAIKMRKPRASLLWDAVRGFLVPSTAGFGFAHSPTGSWLHPWFVRSNRSALQGYPTRVRLFGALPSFQSQIATLNALRRIAASLILRADSLCEMRYPYLDRCLIAYMFAIPREQIVRVGQRRSLMKRALLGIVPEEILKRRQKPLLPLEASLSEGIDVAGTRDYLMSALGIVDAGNLSEALRNLQGKHEVVNGSLLRTLALEAWLRHVAARELVTVSDLRERSLRSLSAEEASARCNVG
jgi:asparagine synthase (glutamine-hydrolysing)